ncbi:VapC toxin family PIN domain ribonuclease [Methylosinus sporium]|uniref:VapC toxin family PIN domain ribonuclease n=1 Tax=Methylosinus sporium TaxID=428 RepID=A0A2U1SUB0_METSR|nr:VapC toxin family PIN domain ribonuclease [Methylosinus sporium]PWB95200.1 VapC toxin family PIN domain ribonuclease [Methylosinus sporium]
MNEAVILLDINVASELMRPKPAQTVLDWFTAQDSTKLFFSAVAELRTDAAILPTGKRSDSLTATIDIMITENFAGRGPLFESAAAKAYAIIAANRRTASQPILEADCQIAAITRVRGATVATRNVRDFEGYNLAIVDPFHVP